MTETKAFANKRLKEVQRKLAVIQHLRGVERLRIVSYSMRGKWETYRVRKPYQGPFIKAAPG